MRTRGQRGWGPWEIVWDWDWDWIGLDWIGLDYMDLEYYYVNN